MRMKIVAAAQKLKHEKLAPDSHYTQSVKGSQEQLLPQCLHKSTKTCGKAWGGGLTFQMYKNKLRLQIERSEFCFRKKT